jgi:hypothetical protein
LVVATLIVATLIVATLIVAPLIVATLIVATLIVATLIVATLIVATLIVAAARSSLRPRTINAEDEYDDCNYQMAFFHVCSYRLAPPRKRSARRISERLGVLALGVAKRMLRKIVWRVWAPLL